VKTTSDTVVGMAFNLVAIQANGAPVVALSLGQVMKPAIA